MSRPVPLSPVPLFFLLLAVLPTGCSSEEPQPLDPERTPGIELTRVGTIGDYPPADARVVINIDRNGEITVDGRVESLESLDRLLDARVEGTWGDDEARSSRLSAVFRIDEAVPFGAADWITRKCCSPSRRIYRIFFAVVPEIGEEEGALASWPSNQYSHSVYWDGLPPMTIRLSIGAKGAPVDPAALHPPVQKLVRRLSEEREAKPVAWLAARPLIPTGVVLRSMDALHRAGVDRVGICGSSIADQVTTIPDLIRQAVQSPPDLALLLDGRRLAASGPVSLPPVRRVRGAFAGTTEDVYSDFRIPRFTETPIGPPTPDDEIDLGLEWLRLHQDPTGLWDCDEFMKRDIITPICDGVGNPHYDLGVTGLALLAFLGAGETHKHGRFKRSVREGLKYLKQVQDDEGCFGPRERGDFIYHHTIAALAMCEVFKLTLSPLFKQSAQQGVDFLVNRPHPDTTVTVCALLTLVSAREAGLRVDEQAFAAARRWLDQVTDPATGRVGLTGRGKTPESAVDAVTAMGVFARPLLGETPETSDPVRKGVAFLRADPPEWGDGGTKVDLVRWLFGALAMRRVGGEGWEVWREALQDAIRGNLRTDGAFEGSLDPVGRWGRTGGRIYSTALAVLCLEVCGGSELVVGHWR